MYRVQRLTKGPIVRRGGLYRVNPALGVFYDVAEFERSCPPGRER